MFKKLFKRKKSDKKLIATITDKDQVLKIAELYDIYLNSLYIKRYFNLSNLWFTIFDYALVAKNNIVKFIITDNFKVELYELKEMPKNCKFEDKLLNFLNGNTKKEKKLALRRPIKVIKNKDQVLELAKLYDEISSVGGYKTRADFWFKAVEFAPELKNKTFSYEVNALNVSFYEK